MLLRYCCKCGRGFSGKGDVFGRVRLSVYFHLSFEKLTFDLDVLLVYGS